MQRGITRRGSQSKPGWRIRCTQGYVSSVGGGSAVGDVSTWAARLLCERITQSVDNELASPAKDTMRRALSIECLDLRYTFSDWRREDSALKGGGDPQPCPCCRRRGFYAPRADDEARRYRACKFCGFWQDVEKEPHEIIRYECRDADHWMADWKEPHEAWQCPRCGEQSNPADAVPWPADDTSHWWHQAPTDGTQSEYRSFWKAKGVEVGPFGIP